MADQKIINTRILLKYDTLAKWEVSTGILRAGEVAIATVPKESTGKEVGSVATPQVLVKVGDGTHTFAELPYITAKAGDVYAWAKQAHPVYISGVNEETGAPIYKNLSDEILSILGDVANLKTFQNGNAQVIANAIKEAKDYTDAEIKKLTHVVDGSGNVVTNVTQANGIVTVTKGTLAVGDLEGGQDVLTDIGNIKTDIAGVKTTATENLAEAKSYTDAEVKELADGQVATNKANIETLMGEATVEGSVKEALAQAKAYAETQASNAETAAKGYADTQAAAAEEAAKNYVDEAIAEITEGETGSLKELAEKVNKNTAAIGTMPTAGEGEEAPTLVGMIAAAEKAADDAVKAEAKRAGDAELALDGRLDTVEAFFAAAEIGGDKVIDTLKEIQEYIESDETGAAEMLASIKENADAIGEMPVGEDGKVNTTLVEMIAAAESAASQAVANEKLRAEGKEAENAAAAAEADRKAVAAQGEIDALEKVVGTPTEGKTIVEMIAAAQTAATYDDSEVRGLISGNTTAISNEVTRATGAEKAINDKIGDAVLTGGHTTLIAAINAANAGVAANAGEIQKNAQAIAAINNAETGILKQAKDYTDAEIVKVNNSITELSGKAVKTIAGDDYIKVDATDVNNVKLSFDTADIVLVAGDSTNLDPAQA